MATAQTMITRAMRLAGVLGTGETPSAAESADGLSTLNTMLESWSIERLYVYYIVQESLTLVPGQATYTMGVGGNLNTARPTQIDDSCFVSYNSMDIPLQLINADAYALIVAKSIQSNLPMYLFADMQNPLVRLSFYPVPNTAYTAAIRSWKQIQTFAALTDVLALPPGYQRAIEYSLAEEYGPEFGVDVPPRVSAIAGKARTNLKRINAVSPIMLSEAGAMSTVRRPANIYTGM
jgi:hypothetical protein